jgi:hypothetical protein
MSRPIQGLPNTTQRFLHALLFDFREKMQNLQKQRHSFSKNYPAASSVLGASDALDSDRPCFVISLTSLIDRAIGRFDSGGDCPSQFVQKSRPTAWKSWAKLT